MGSVGTAFSRTNPRDQLEPWVTCPQDYQGDLRKLPWSPASGAVKLIVEKTSFHFFPSVKKFLEHFFLLIS